MVKEMTPRQFVEARAAGSDLTLLDVREAWETELAPVPSAVVHIPMAEVPERLAELDPKRETVVICRSGGRSMQVARFLDSKDFGSVYNLAGGILAWSAELDPSIPRY
jgi:rhodanese-related sulfurtransferase